MECPRVFPQKPGGDYDAIGRTGFRICDRTCHHTGSRAIIAATSEALRFAVKAALKPVRTPSKLGALRHWGVPLTVGRFVWASKDNAVDAYKGHVRKHGCKS
jgi:hypothetical protein